MFGIAIVVLLVIGAAVIISAKTGIVVPARWFGVFYWTCALLWFVFRQHKRDLRSGRFWTALSAFLMVHITAFAIVLQAYPAWGPIWFMFVFMIEGPLVLVSFQNIVDPSGVRKHVYDERFWR